MQTDMYIAQRRVQGAGESFRAICAATGAAIDPVFHGGTESDVDAACAAAEAALDPFRSMPIEQRADFLDAVADNIAVLGDALIERCTTETGLPQARVVGERARTIGQLRMFANLVRSGRFLGVRIDEAIPDRQPLPRPDLRLRYIPVGPVAIFGASNFPLAFSVAGGDTASALAAGCPVVVKAHPAHPGTSALIGGAIAEAVKSCGVPAGTFSLLFEPGYTLGQRLVADPRIKAVGFTGSRRAGLALIEIAQRRAEPIPVYAEMSSINPVLLMPHALEERATEIAEAFVGSLLNGAGQFCTSPGLLLAVEGTGLDAFLAAAGARVAVAAAAMMLTPGILRAYEAGVKALALHQQVETVARGAEATGRAQAGLFATDVSSFIGDRELQAEIFGSSALVVKCRDLGELRAIFEQLEGQLTASVHSAPADYPEVKQLVPLLERRAGRIIFDGFGTGVEVCDAIVHGGPFPATSDTRSSSVGTIAIDRFLRPVSYQNMPAPLRCKVFDPTV